MQEKDRNAVFLFFEWSEPDFLLACWCHFLSELCPSFQTDWNVRKSSRAQSVWALCSFTASCWNQRLWVLNRCLAETSQQRAPPPVTGAVTVCFHAFRCLLQPELQPLMLHNVAPAGSPFLIYTFRKHSGRRRYVPDAHSASGQNPSSTFRTSLGISPTWARGRKD